MGTNKELYAKQTTEKMMGITRHMLQDAFKEAFCDAYGDSWFDKLKEASKTHATDDEGIYNRAYDITGDKKSVNGLDFSACIKTIIYLDEHRNILLNYFHAKMSENSICDVCHKLIAYRNYASSAHENDEDMPDFVISSEMCMDNLKFLAGFFSNVINPKTDTSYKDELEECYNNYKNETKKRFYPFDEIFDTSEHSIDTYIKAANHCGIPVYLSDTLMKQGFDSYNLDKDKKRILRAIALINGNSSESDSISDEKNKSSKTKNKKHGISRLKSPKIIIPAAFILIIAIVVSVVGIYFANQNEEYTYVSGEAVFDHRLHFVIEEQAIIDGQIEIKIENRSLIRDYQLGTKNDLCGIYINDSKTPSIEFGPIDINHQRSQKLKFDTSKYNNLSSIKITNILIDSYLGEKPETVIHIKEFTSKEPPNKQSEASYNYDNIEEKTYAEAAYEDELLFYVDEELTEETDNNGYYTIKVENLGKTTYYFDSIEVIGKYNDGKEKDASIKKPPEKIKPHETRYLYVYITKVNDSNWYKEIILDCIYCYPNEDDYITLDPINLDPIKLEFKSYKEKAY